MSTYLTSDIHGNYKKLNFLINKINFNFKYDNLLVAGDLVGRGPDSLEVLRYLKSFGNNVKIVLGNYDIRLLLIYFGFQKPNKYDNFDLLLKSNDISQLIDWLRKQPFLFLDKNKKIIMVHAGVYPLWSIDDLQCYANQIQTFLSGDLYYNFLKFINNTSLNIKWDKNINLLDQLRFSINAFTKMRYCNLDKTLNMDYKDTPSYKSELKLLKPWFAFKSKIDKKYSIFFGHWSTLSRKIISYNNNIIPLDSGCCWGKELSVMRFDDKKWFKKY